MASKTDSPAARTLSFGSAAFDELLQNLSAEARENGGVRVLFAGASGEAANEALATLATDTDLNLHQIKLAPLVSDRPEATRGNVREVFDASSEDASVLYLHEAGAFLEQPEEAAADADELTPVDYLFQRIKAHRSIVILCLEKPAHVARARDAAPFDVIVEF